MRNDPRPAVMTADELAPPFSTRGLLLTPFLIRILALMAVMALSYQLA